MTDNIAVRCPGCGKSKFVERHEIDPDAAVMMLHLCEECEPDCEATPVMYLDAEGDEVEIEEPERGGEAW